MSDVIKEYDCYIIFETNTDGRSTPMGVIFHVTPAKLSSHDDVIKWKHFPRCWPFVRGIHGSPVNSPHKGQWRWALMFSLICAQINRGVNNREAGDLRRHYAHYDVIVMIEEIPWNICMVRLCFVWLLLYFPSTGGGQRSNLERYIHNKIWWLCLVPTSDTRFASGMGYRIAKL